MRLPRKLKKGFRTLNGNPRTKWQRKGRLHFAKILNNVANSASASLLVWYYCEKQQKEIPDTGVM